MKDTKKILVINPGSTSTKIAVYENNQNLFEETIRHKSEELAVFKNIPDQKEYRYQEIEKMLTKNNFKIEDIDAIAARGGLLKPIESGIYQINDEMVKDLTNSYAALHASCISGLIGYELSKKYDIPAYIVDPVVVDELSSLARVSGIPQIERISVFHALNQKSIAKQAARDMGKRYSECNFIIAHMGGGITVVAHHEGKAIDLNNGIEGEGPFSPERCGALPVGQVLNLCESTDYSIDEIRAFTTKTGGMLAYLGTNDLRVCQEMIDNNDAKAKLVFDAMAYQIAKEIGAMAAVLKGKVDAIILTGGLAYSNIFTDEIAQYINFIADIKIYPGENEIEALAFAVLDALNNKEEIKIYK